MKDLIKMAVAIAFWIAISIAIGGCACVSINGQGNCAEWMAKKNKSTPNSHRREPGEA